MRKYFNAIRVLVIIICMIMSFSACTDSTNTGNPTATPNATATPIATATPTEIATPTEAAKVQYKDGTYELVSDKDFEGYFAKATLTIKDGQITDFNYELYDSNNGDRLFDETYEELMPSQVYKQQCRDDLKGMKTYGPKLVETQSVDEVDVVSKATWTWKWFKEVAQELLDKATV